MISSKIRKSIMLLLNKLFIINRGKNLVQTNKLYEKKEKEQMVIEVKSEFHKGILVVSK
jgi:hypothetical protein